jgi:hypothetical protein
VYVIHTTYQLCAILLQVHLAGQKAVLYTTLFVYEFYNSITTLLVFTTRILQVVFTLRVLQPFYNYTLYASCISYTRSTHVV